MFARIAITIADHEIHASLGWSGKTVSARHYVLNELAANGIYRTLRISTVGLVSKFI